MNLILLHGIVGFHSLFREGYMRHIGDFLQAEFASLPLRVLVPAAPPIASIATRAKEIRKQIEAAFATGKLDATADTRTHIFGHSMGGLDARYLVSSATRMGLRRRIASVTLIGTPNHGTPVAEFFLGKLADEPMRAATNASGLGHSGLGALRQVDVDLAGVRAITRQAMRDFNARVIDNAAVRYFCVAGVGRAGLLPTSNALLPLHALTEWLSGERNDGFVPVSSAAWGSHPLEAWPADHGDLVGIDLNMPFANQPTIYARYRKWVERIAGVEG
jgi:triacylglycerol lipase